MMRKPTPRQAVTWSLLACALVLLAGGIKLVGWANNYSARLESEYATAEALRSVTRYVEKTGQWPAGWADLDFAAERRAGVRIRFDLTLPQILANPDLLRAAIVPAVGEYHIYPHWTHDLEQLLSVLRSRPQIVTAAQPSLKALEALYHRYRIEFSAEHRTEAMTLALERWRDSLATNLNVKQPNRSVHVFLRTDIVLVDRGEPREGCVFERVQEAGGGAARTFAQGPLYFVLPPDGTGPVIIDRAGKEVGTMGVNGITRHPHPGGAMVVILEPAPGPPGTGLMGVPLGEEKSGAEAPVFDGDVVRWTW